MKRLLAARLWHEGNSFAAQPTVMDDFRRCEWLRGTDAAQYYRDAETELSAIACLDAGAGLEVRFSRCAAAAPGGPLVAGLYPAIRDELLDDVRDFRPDAILLSLHGALLADDVDAPDLDLLRAVRAVTGPETLIGVSLDLHANLHPELAELAQIVSAYQTYPHLDMRATGQRVLELMQRALRGEIRPRCACVPVQRVLPSHAMRTDGQGPMAEIQQALRRREAADPRLLALSALGGFAYADTAHAGATGLACVDGDRQLALASAAEVRDQFVNRLTRFFPALPNARDGLRQAKAALHGSDPRPVAVIDPADNPLSGGAGDTTDLLRELLAAPSVGDTIFAFFHDPALVQRACAAGIGAELEVALGGRRLPHLSQPVALRLRVAHVTDGHFANTGPMWTGRVCDIGPSVVLVHLQRPLRIVITTTCETPNDPAWFALHAIDLDRIRLLCIKAKNHFRAAFATRFATLIDIDAPGPACLDLTALPFRTVPLERRRAPPSEDFS